MTTTATFRFTTKSSGCENFGPVDYTVTDTLTAVDGGIRVDSHALGWAEGVRVNDRSSTFHPGVSLEAACAYRESHGYSRVG